VDILYSMILLDLFRDDFSHIYCFSKLSTRAHMSVPIVDSDSLSEIESNEYNNNVMQEISIFRYWTHDGGLLVIPDNCGEFR
jgi:hypothetical protein